MFIKLGKYFLGVSALAVLASIVVLFNPGPNLSIDFTGGTLVELAGSSKEAIQESINTLQMDPAIGNISYSATKDGSVLLRMRDLTNEEHLALLDHLSASIEGIDERQYTTIGPTVGETLKSRAIWALVIASIAIVFYIAFAFRKVPRKLSAWRFGVIAVITLLHDVLITVGIFVLISQNTSFEFDTLFITALLTILGYSVNDTIVIFDRIRENLTLQGRGEDFAAVAERSLRESIPRSINTSVSTLIMLCCLFILGSESIRWFVLTLIVGALIGTYSSIFLATPLLVFWKKKKN